MTREETLSLISCDAETIKVIALDISDMLTAENQHRMHAIYTVAEDIISKAAMLSKLEVME